MTIKHSGGWYKYECYTPLKLRTTLRPQEQTFKAIREQELLAFDVQSNNETLEGLCAALFPALGPVAASKFLHFSAPALLPMWDSKLRRAAGYKNSAAGYIAYMTAFQQPLTVKGNREAAKRSYATNIVRAWDIVCMKRRLRAKVL
jgi:hypothetical protein